MLLWLAKSICDLRTTSLKKKKILALIKEGRDDEQNIWPSRSHLYRFKHYYSFFRPHFYPAPSKQSPAMSSLGSQPFPSLD